jgi:ABC-type phosphate transport system substrate-binding protein
MTFSTKVFVIAVFCLFVSKSVTALELVVVVNKNNDIESLTKKQVIDIYMGRYQSFPNGTPAKPIDHPIDSDYKRTFYIELVNLSENRLKSYWSRLLFSGRARPPLETQSPDDVIQLLKEDHTSVAYLPKSAITEEMKIVYQF